MKKITTGQVCGLAFHVYTIRYHAKRGRLPTHWHSRSKGRNMLIASMATDHLVNSLALLQRAREHPFDFRRTPEMKRALLYEIGRRTQMTYAGPQELAKWSNE